MTDEMPGMWERTDFERGKTDAEGVVVTADLSVPAPQPNPSNDGACDHDPGSVAQSAAHRETDKRRLQRPSKVAEGEGSSPSRSTNAPAVPSARVDLDEIEADFADPGVVGLWNLGTVGTGPLCRLVAAVPALVAEVKRLRAIVGSDGNLEAMLGINLPDLTSALKEVQAERDAARAEAEELRLGYRTVCDYAEQHDATRAELNEARAEAERLREDAYEEKRRAEQSRSAAYQRLVEDRDRYLEAWQASVAEAARVREALQAAREFVGWLTAMGEPTHEALETRRAVTLVDIISRARAALRALDAALDGAE